MAEKDVGYLIKNINDKLKAKADAGLKHYYLTLTQSRVLTFLSGRGGQATQKEIEVFLEVSHPTVVGVVSRMAQNGFVTCWQDADRRNKIVQLTPKAQSIAVDLDRHMGETEAHLLASLTAEDARKLKELLTTIYDHLED